MAGEWGVQTFAELIGGRENIIGGPFGSNLTQADYTTIGIPVIRGSNMEQAGRYIAGPFVYVGAEKAARLASNQVEAGNIIVTQRGTMGQVSIVPSEPSTRYVVSQSQMGVRVQKSDPLFVYYLLRSTAFLNFLDGATIQTGVPHINMGLLRAWKVAAPDVQQQTRIAELLGALDEKIELNCRMAETLETLARALFRSWFIDFDPIRAKVKGEKTGLSSDLEALFPDSFDEEGLPIGWGLSPLREQVCILSGGTPNKSELAYWGGNIPWVTPRSMVSSHVSETPDSVTPAAIGNGTRIAPAGSILVMVRGMGLHQGVRVSQARCDVSFNQDVKALVPAKLDESYLLYAVLDQQLLLRAKVRAAGHGTGVLPTDALDAIKIPIPPTRAHEGLFRPFGVINERVALARSHAQTLASLRDTLLPKLISGELRIADAMDRIAAA
ncbi:restriction endonuclease subunit S [Methylobacterium sp. WL69]|uniref:restriction endonuclease subunit S n=1 Tax=Methylobacterium sp. WL69 TaxID=2603893 RepID=UPI0011C8534B|nr:restriction endonuclease subunit S [Methylobacterium sp. WL69]TXM69023.1 restriction endonuclease subunit S [Methylobacterium sp. WL69]